MARKSLHTVVIVFAGLVALRIVVGPPQPRGLVVFADLERAALESSAFELDATTRLVVDATGLVDTREGASGLAATAWIRDFDNGKIVWDMQAQRLSAGAGSLRHIKADTFILGAGLYEVFYATYGLRADQRIPRARLDNRSLSSLRFVLRTADKNDNARRLDFLPPKASNTPLLWEATMLGDNEHREFAFEVLRPTDIAVSATGEISTASGHEPRDHYWIEHVQERTRVWFFALQNSEPAGGAASNRRFTGRINLVPGIYRAFAETNRSHAYGLWVGNPPYDPSAWGISIAVEDSDAILPFDPWQTRQPLLSFVRVGNDEHLKQHFRVGQPLGVVLYSVGEVTGNYGTAYDYGQLTRIHQGREELVWKLAPGDLLHAGGSYKNLYKSEFLYLEPGTYALEYITDDSHAWDSWNAEAPDNPERWGIAMFPVSRTLPTGAFAISDGMGDAAQGLPLGQAREGRGQDLFSNALSEAAATINWTRLEAHEEREVRFAVSQPTRIRIRAVGEISTSTRFDYGMLKRTGDDQPVWEMTRYNTVAAGGGDENRLFSGFVSLDAGEYVLRFVTDGTHHYGDFGAEVPDHPGQWGIAVWMDQ